jgi:hypothetical protein
LFGQWLGDTKFMHNAFKTFTEVEPSHQSLDLLLASSLTRKKSTLAIVRSDGAESAADAQDQAKSISFQSPMFRSHLTWLDLAQALHSMNDKMPLLTNTLKMKASKSHRIAFIVPSLLLEDASMLTAMRSLHNSFSSSLTHPYQVVLVVEQSKNTPFDCLSLVNRLDLEEQYCYLATDELVVLPNLSDDSSTHQQSGYYLAEIWKMFDFDFLLYSTALSECFLHRLTTDLAVAMAIPVHGYQWRYFKSFTQLTPGALQGIQSTLSFSFLNVFHQILF